MWSPLVFCLIVSVAFATNTPAWKPNKEYIYKIQGRALAGLEIANQFSGILIKASLRIQTRPDGKLQSIILNPQYAHIHSELSDGWMSPIPDHEVSWKPLEMSRKPFQIEMSHGVITDLIVSKNIPNWEANIIKGIVSQFQINLNEADSHVSQSDNRQNAATYTVYEETVSGNADTLYTVHPVPEYMLLTPQVSDFQTLEEDDDEVLEVLKYKNYTDSIELPSYYYGFGNLKQGQAATNTMGRFFLRSTTTRCLVTGSLKQFTVQHTMTLNHLLANPTLGDKQQGGVYTMWNTTLKEVKPLAKRLEEVSQPVNLKGLVYAYGKPYDQTNEVRERKSIKNVGTEEKSTSQLQSPIYSQYASLYYQLKQKQPQVNEAPETPFLPFYIGDKGHAVKMELDAIKNAIQMSQEIGADLLDPRRSLHNNTPEKFITLTALLRTFDEVELRKIYNELYSTKDDSEKYMAWAVFRDAVAASGHGPALLLIQSWIEVTHIKFEEAAHIIATMTRSVQHPTTQYIKTLFDLIKKPVVTSQWPLNETAILSFSELVRKVYYETHFSINQYPINTFENLRGKDGVTFIRDTVIPYFGQQLEKAINAADTEKIHTYIRALGYIGEPQILKIFEPYLEGKKQCSQFQRALMVVSLDRLVKTYPKVAQEILFRIYQNSGEFTPVRMTAVFQLMRTSPSVQMLQFMASFTNIDTDEQVNAVVKSSILTASKLQPEEFKPLRDAANMAKPMLNNVEYGVQYGGNYLEAYFDDQLQLYYKQTMQYWGSDYQFVSNSLKYALRSDVRGLKNQIVNVQALISSVRKLVNVFNEQTKHYETMRQQQEQNSAEQKEHPFSSQNIAKILSMKSEVDEQLEGSIFLMDMDSPYKMLAFDNHTVENLPEAIRRWEEKIRNGQKIDYVKFINTDYKVIAVPNEMGLPFVFTYNAPVYIRVLGKVDAVSTPEISQNGKIHMPHKLQANINVTVTVGAKLQGHISFITPFDNQQYISGFDKVFQAHVPVRSNVQVDLKKHEVQIDVQPKEVYQQAHLLHYSTWPYTARRNILDFTTLPTQGHSQHIIPQNVRSWKHTVGRTNAGLAFKIELEHDRDTITTSDIGVICKHGFVNGFKYLWKDANIQYSHVNVSYIPEESTTKQVRIRLGYQQDYRQKAEENSLNWDKVAQASKPSSRQEILMKATASGIKHVQTRAVDASVEFQGDNNKKYIASVAYSSSNIDDKSRVYGILKADNENEKPLEIKLEAVNKVPNVVSLNLEDALKNVPKAESTVEVKFTSEKGKGEVKANIKFTRSEERKQYLKETAKYDQCIRDVREGNKQTPACLNMTIEANLLDRVSVDFTHKNLKPYWQYFIETIYSHFRYMYYPNLDMKFNKQSVQQNQLKLEARFDPDLHYVNISVQRQEDEAIFRGIRLNEYAKRMFVVHPVFDVSVRTMSKSLEIETFKRACVVDRSQVTTFTNFTYPVDISKKWTVVAQYVPRVSDERQQEISVDQLLTYVPTNYAILVRQNKKSKEAKDVKIVLSNPETKYKVVDITLTSSQQGSGSKAAVTINEQQVESYDILNGYIQIYTLPNGETKVHVQNEFVLIYDGQTTKLITITETFRNSIRGLCGQDGYNQYEDFITPQNCYAQNMEKLVRSYEVEGSEGQEIRQQFEKNTEQCIDKRIPRYINVIKETDFNTNELEDGSQGNDCMRYQTKYVEQNNEICFTTRTVPSCRSHCKAGGFFTKTISAHCIPYSNVAQLWKNQIDHGHNPDFTHKPENRKLQMELPQTCSA